MVLAPEATAPQAVKSSNPHVLSDLAVVVGPRSRSSATIGQKQQLNVLSDLAVLVGPRSRSSATSGQKQQLTCTFWPDSLCWPNKQRIQAAKSSNSEVRALSDLKIFVGPRSSATIGQKQQLTCTVW
jgi:hypothetical protein